MQHKIKCYVILYLLLVYGSMTLMGNVLLLRIVYKQLRKQIETTQRRWSTTRQTKQTRQESTKQICYTYSE